MSHCASCRYFDNSPEAFERAFPGLTSFGSGSAAVRDEDGLCRLHDRHLSSRSRCKDFQRLDPMSGGTAAASAGVTSPAASP